MSDSKRFKAYSEAMPVRRHAGEMMRSKIVLITSMNSWLARHQNDEIAKVIPCSSGSVLVLYYTSVPLKPEKRDG